MKNSLLCMILVLFIFGCKNELPEEQTKPTTSFASIAIEHSGISFTNNVIESDTLNYFTFPYMYMGGGVAIGDINNDGLSDIYLTGNMSENKLYLNKGNMQFEDISESAGVSGDDRWYTGVTMADVNADGWLDIYVSVSGIFGTTKNQLFINNRDNTFSEKARSYGLDDETASIQATFFDYDKDGLLDVFVANYPVVKVSMGNIYYHELMQENRLENSGHLYKNNGDNTFTDVTSAAGVQNFGMTLGIVASDYNNDGWQDLYLSNDFNVPDYFYLNNGDGTFREVSKDATNHTAMFGMGIDVADFNNDALLDMVQLDMTPSDYKRSKTNMASMNPESFYEAVDLGLHYQYMQNTLQVNNGINSNGIPVFSDISRLANLATTDWSWGTLFADFDNDGLKDIIVTNGMKRDVNNNDVNKRTNITSFTAYNKSIDYRQYPSTPLDNYVFRNEGDFKFSKVNEQWNISYKGFSNGVSYGDLDNDGDLDIVINNLDDTASVFQNGRDIQPNGNFLKIKLNGPKNNPNGLGAKVKLVSNNSRQFQEFTLSRGFQSSVDPMLHFGLGGDSTIDSLSILWPNNKTQVLTKLEANQLLVLDEDDASMAGAGTSPTAKVFLDITDAIGIDFVHTEDDYDDYDNEPLLPHKNSQIGPALTVGDINGDGLDDFFVGNAAGSTSQMYIQNETGSFTVFEGPWEQEFEKEDVGALLFDADGDNDLDLYVVSGGNDPEKAEDYYQDRLYENTADGFVKNNQALPEVNSSGLEVSASDYDGDGDLDLFVGGRIIPGKYPFPPKSYILRNESSPGTVKFTDVTSEVLPQIENAGLVTSSLWDDFDSDGEVDLIIAGEWMPIRIFKNLGGKFKEVTASLGLDEKIGWWYSLEKIDYDQDGDMDYVAGNLGLNYKYVATQKAPFEVYANDFDENGSMDIVLSYKKKGVQLPLRGRECSSEQVPAIKRRFQTFELFADATLADIYGQAMLDKSLNYQATTFASSWIENEGKGKFVIHELPRHIQWSSINDMEAILNGDASTTMIFGGNLYQSEVETPRNDASFGGVLSFEPIKSEPLFQNGAQTGLFIKGEVRKIKSIRLGSDGKKAILFAVNNDSLKVFHLKE